MAQSPISQSSFIFTPLITQQPDPNLESPFLKTQNSLAHSFGYTKSITKITVLSPIKSKHGKFESLVS